MMGNLTEATKLLDFDSFSPFFKQGGLTDSLNSETPV